MFKKIIASAALLAVSAMPFAASAGSASSTLNVSATVVGNCSITINPTLNFGTYDFINNASNALTATTTNNSVTCSKGFAPSNISFNDKPNYNSPYALALSGPGGDTLNTILSATPGESWQNTAGSAGAFNIIGVAAAGQNPSVGAYSGSVVVNVNF